MVIGRGRFSAAPFFETMNKYNLLIDEQETTTESGATWPLEVDEVKAFLRLEGFIDDSESPSSDFDDDDDLIDELIRSAVLRAEAYTGLSFRPKTYKIEFTNLAGSFVIPYGPVTEITSLYSADDEDETEIDYTTTINKAKLKTPLQENLVMEYSAGYESLPDGLKEALLKEVAYRYTHRGDDLEDTGFCKQALSLLNPYKEVDTWLG